MLADEPIGNYNAALKPSWWPDRILHRILIAYANEYGINSVRAFASATSPYHRVLETTKWSGAGITDALILAPEVASGGTVKSPASIGEALTALSNRHLDEDWKSSHGLRLNIHGG